MEIKRNRSPDAIVEEFPTIGGWAKKSGCAGWKGSRTAILGRRVVATAHERRVRGRRWGPATGVGER